MKTERKMLIAALLLATILFSCFMPVLQVGANTDEKITFESNLYAALKEELTRKQIEAGYIDEQRTIIIGDEEIAKVTDLSLSNAELTDLRGLEKFKNLSILNLSANELTKDSYLEVLSSLENLSSLDLSSNAIEDVSMITNLDSIPSVKLHNQKFNVVEIIELDTSKTSDQKTQVTYALPQILSKAGYLETDWLIEENKVKETNGRAPYFNWSRFDHNNLKIEVATKMGASYIPYKEMVTLRIKISDTTNMLYNTDINMFFIVVDSDERGIHIADENMYKAIKEQLDANYDPELKVYKGQKVNSDLISYYLTTPSSLRRNLYNRFYNEPQVLVIDIDDIINKIGSLKLSNKKIRKLDGIEKFVGLDKELDLSGNYIKSIDKLIELQENQIKEEELLRGRVSEQLSLVADTISQINATQASIQAEEKAKEALVKTRNELEGKLDELTNEISNLNKKKAELEEAKQSASDRITELNNQIETLPTIIESLKSELESKKAELEEAKKAKEVLDSELAKLKEELANLNSDLENEKEKARKAIADKEAEIAAQNEKINQKQKDIENKQAEIDGVQSEIADKEQQKSSLMESIATYDVQISDINILIAQNEAEIEEINGKLQNSTFTSFTISEEEKEDFIEKFIKESKEKIDSLANEIDPDLQELAYYYKGTMTGYEAINDKLDELVKLFSDNSNNPSVDDINTLINDLDKEIDAGIAYVINANMTAFWTTTSEPLLADIRENIISKVYKNLQILETKTETLKAEAKSLIGTSNASGKLQATETYKLFYITEAEYTKLLEDYAVEFLDFLRESATSEIDYVYETIENQMEVISGLVADDATTTEIIETEIKELEEILDESKSYMREADIWWRSTDGNSEALDAEINTFKTLVCSDIEKMENNITTLKETVIQLNTEYKSIAHKADFIEKLKEEKARVQAEIDEIEKAISDDTKTDDINDQISDLETEKDTLETELDNLKKAKDDLEKDMPNLEKDLADLKSKLENIKDDTEYKKILQQITAKEAEIDTKEKTISGAQNAITAQEKVVSDKEAEIKAKEAELAEAQAAKTKAEEEKKSKEAELEAKEAEIKAKLAEQLALIEQFNAQNKSIAAIDVKIDELIANLSVLNELLVGQMDRLYTIYNRIDKLASFGTVELKALTDEEFNDLTYDQSKAMFNNQIAKIASIEKMLTGFETKYLLEQYGIPTTRTVTFEEIVQNPDGTTHTQQKTETEEIENPIATFFNELAKNSEKWSVSQFKAYIQDFREIDTIFSMVEYCYLLRLFDGYTTCQADKYADIEIEKLEFYGNSTAMFKEIKNNFEDILDEYSYVCSGKPGLGSLIPYASRMVNASGDINTYVCLERIKSLNVNENLIENIDNVAELTDLFKLYAYDNEIVDISTINWANMTKLAVLDLGFNGISDIKSLESLTNIQEIYLKKNLISGSFDLDLSKFEKLSVLDLSENQIDDIEDLIKFLRYEARAYNIEDIAMFLRSYYIDIRLNNQALTMKVDRKAEINEKFKVDLPKIFEQIEEIDSENTSFGIDSLRGNVTNDGKQVSLDTTREGNFNALVSIINTGYKPSIGSGITCSMNYTVGNIEPINVTITPDTAEVNVGEEQQFTAEVTGDRVSYKGVKWEVIGATSAETTVSEAGLLKIGADETAEKVVVKATSMYDESVSKEVEVTIIHKVVTGVTITPENPTVFKGESVTFTAEVLGNGLEDADKEIVWDVLIEESEDAELSEGTSAKIVDGKLVLSIGKEEKINKFIVVAISKLNEEFKAETVVTVDERTVSQVKVTPETASIEVGKTQIFTAEVLGENLRAEDKAVTYTVSGNTSSDTTITKDGLLTIATNEKAERITVKVTSNFDSTKTAEVVVTVVKPESNIKLGYTIEEEYIVGVATKTPVDAFKDILTKEYTVVVKENNTAVTSGYMKTGMMVEVQDENGNIVEDENGNLLVYEVVVKGDINSDGVADAIDTKYLKAIRNESSSILDVQERAADIDDDGDVDVIDSKLLLYHRAEVRNYCLDYVEQ